MISSSLIVNAFRVDELEVLDTFSITADPEAVCSNHLVLTQIREDLHTKLQYYPNLESIFLDPMLMNSRIQITTRSNMMKEGIRRIETPVWQQGTSVERKMMCSQPLEWCTKRLNPETRRMMVSC